MRKEILVSEYKEPWVLDEDTGNIRLGNEKGPLLKGTGDEAMRLKSRVVLCVNALTGLTNEEVMALREEEE
jgi:hypothetical protein